MRLLILEPDEWRYLGIGTVLKESEVAELIDERDYAKILTLESAPEDLRPDVIMLAHKLVIQYGISLVPHLRDLFPGAHVLVHGDHDSLEVSAQLLVVGASGYFVLSSPPHYLIHAVGLVARGKLWGPREAVERMAQRAASVLRQESPEAEKDRRSEFTKDESELLRLLHEGLANKEIAARLGVAEVTVKARLTKLYKKFGVTSRLQLLSTAIKKGLLDQPAPVASKTINAL